MIMEENFPVIFFPGKLLILNTYTEKDNQWCVMKQLKNYIDKLQLALEFFNYRGFIKSIVKN